MATMAGRQINQTYGDVLSIDNANSGVDGTYRSVQSGDGTESGLQLSTAGARIPAGKELKILGTFNFASASTMTGKVAVANGGTGVASVASARTVLGGGAVGISVFQSVAAASARTALGGGTVGVSVFQASAAASARNALGAGTVGASVFQSSAAASGRTALGLGTAAVVNTGVSNGNVPLMDGTGYPAANGSQITNITGSNVTQASDGARGTVELATTAETQALSSTSLAVTPGGLATIGAPLLLETLDTSSGGTVTSGTLPACRALLIIPASISASTTASMRLAVSDDDGGNWSGNVTFSDSVGGGFALGGWVLITGTGATGNKLVHGMAGAVGVVTDMWLTTTVISSVTGVVNKIRFSPSAGNFDNGAVYIYGIR